MISFSAEVGHRLNESASISAKTGVKLFQQMALVVAIKVYGVVITSPVRRRLFNATKSASVPLLNKETLGVSSNLVSSLSSFW